MDSNKPESTSGIDGNTPDNDIRMIRKNASSTEHRLQALSIALETAQAGYWEWNIATGQISVDRQWAAITGINPDVMQMLTLAQWKALCNPDDIGRVIEKLETFCDGDRELLELELRVRHQTGDWQAVLDRGKILERDVNGRALCIVGSRHAVQKHHLNGDTPLNGTIKRNSEKELQSLFDNIPGAVYRMDVAGNTTIVSKPPHFLSLHDSETPQFDIMAMVHPDDRQKVLSSIRRLREKKESVTLVYRILTQKNTLRWVEDHKTSAFSDDGHYTGIDGILCDVSDRIASQEEARRLEAQLRKSQRLETIGTLAGGIAHDFNNILTPILGYSEMGLSSLTEDDPLHEFLTEIMHAAERAQKLVAQILTFSRAQDGKTSSVNVQAIIAESLRLLRPSLPATISIEQRIETSCRNVLADPSQIHQVVINLCTNAFHAMEDTGGTLFIGLKEIRPEETRTTALLQLPEDRYAELTIADTGTGMDETTMERIFEPFYTTKTIEKGTGLGLSVVHGIVTGANGQITVESVKGEGSTFHVYLPVIDAPLPTEQREKPRIMKQSGEVLFVDDEPAAVQMMTIMMTKLGFRITAEQSPAEALERFREQPGQFDLVITDLTMPEMTGLQLAAELHKIAPAIPVILMTGYGKIIDHDTPLSYYGISRLLKKPVKLVQLASAVNEVLSATKPSIPT